MSLPFQHRQYLGMTLMNNDFGSLRQSDRSRYNVKTVPGQLVSGIGNGLFRMPLRHPGKLTQLGKSPKSS